ncbi:DUF2061 domain-containing protein [Pedomonas sp. V897]|uniref:DUF2061 domain-containing protein n=1 Tax=Pedomonas sp. V897 TaxID=3446482 RepID=UPI003EE0E992
MKRDLAKTLSFLSLHFVVGFSVAYAFTGQAGVSSAIALVEPMANAVVFFFHERAWRRADAGLARDHAHGGDSGRRFAFHC